MCVPSWSLGVEELRGLALWTCCHPPPPARLRMVSREVGAPSASAALFRVTCVMGEQPLPDQERTERCWQLLPSAGSTLERTAQWAPKPGIGVGGASLVPKLWDGSGSPSSLTAPMDFGEVALGLASCEPTPVQCSDNREAELGGKIRLKSQ